MLVGYARTSSLEQAAGLEAQTRDLKHLGCEKIFQEQVSAVGERAMTVYLWHMPVLVALAGLGIAANAIHGVPLPEPLSPAWWVTRPLWLAAGAAAVVPVVLVLARFERGRRTGRQGSHATVPTARVAVATTTVDAVAGVAGVAVLLVAGFGPLPAVVALVLLGIALIGTARLTAWAGLR